jgi:hypothetical protein
MAYSYWIATFEVPRGNGGRCLELPEGEKINRLIEWKVDLVHHCFLITAMVEKQVETPHARAA